MTAMNESLLQLALLKREMEQIEAEYNRRKALFLDDLEKQRKNARATYSGAETRIKTDALESYLETGETGHPVLVPFTTSSPLVTDPHYLLRAAILANALEFLQVDTKRVLAEAPEWALPHIDLDHKTTGIRLVGLSVLLETASTITQSTGELMVGKDEDDADL